MFGLLGSALGKVLGSKDVIKNAMSGIDKSIFTREESADYMLKFLSAYEPFKLAQRILSTMFSAVFLFGIFAGIVTYVVGIALGDNAVIVSSKDLILTTWKSLGTPESLIIGFYFAGGTINSLMRKDNGRKHTLAMYDDNNDVKTRKEERQERREERRANND